MLSDSDSLNAVLLLCTPDPLPDMPVARQNMGYDTDPGCFEPITGSSVPLQSVPTLTYVTLLRGRLQGHLYHYRLCPHICDTLPRYAKLRCERDQIDVSTKP